MKVEILSTGAIETVLAENNVQFTKRYSGDRYKVIELEKSDAKKISGQYLENAWCKLSNGAGGSPFDIISVHGNCLIGWPANKDTYKKLTDYISALGANDDDDVCDYAVGLAKANGMNMSMLFARFEG